MTEVPQPRDQRLLRRGLRLEYATLSWNVVGVVVVVGAAIASQSVALAGFGLDSGVEIFASVVVIWELRGAVSEERQRRGLQLIGGAFAAIALYIGVQSVYALWTGHRAEHSALGIVWLSATVVVMFVLARAKSNTGRAMGNQLLVTEARVTLIDGFLAAGVLVGLVLSSWLAWWWADPLAGLLIVAYAIHETRAIVTDLRSSAGPNAGSPEPKTG